LDDIYGTKPESSLDARVELPTNTEIIYFLEYNILRYNFILQRSRCTVSDALGFLEYWLENQVWESLFGFQQPKNTVLLKNVKMKVINLPVSQHS
jgi:hypothetical protein